MNYGNNATSTERFIIIIVRLERSECYNYNNITSEASSITTGILGNKQWYKPIISRTTHKKSILELELEKLAGIHTKNQGSNSVATID